MTIQRETVKRPGHNLTQAGLVLLLIGVLIAVISVANGGHAFGALWLCAAGLVLAAIGFGIRVLAALERR